MSDSFFIPSPLKPEQKKRFSKRYLLLILVGLLVTAYFGDIGSFYFLFYGFSGLLLVTWLWLRISLKKLTVQRHYDTRAFFGQKICIQLSFHNRGRWPILWLGINESLPWHLATPKSFFQVVTSFLPGERALFDYELACHRRGYYTLGPMEFQSGDFWGIFTPRAYTVPSQTLIVYPKTVSLTGLSLVSQSPLGTLKSVRPLIDDPNAPMGVRPYLPGDSMKQIDWKTTAVTGNLQVKHFQSSKAMDAQVVLNLDKTLLDLKGWEHTIERGVTMAASLATWLNEQRQAFGLTTFGHDPLSETTGEQNLSLAKGHIHLTQVLELLARIQDATIETFQAKLQKICSKLPWGTLVIIVIPKIEKEFFYDLLSFRRKGLQPILILTNPNQDFAQLKAQGKKINVPCFKVENDRDFELWKGKP